MRMTAGEYEIDDDPARIDAGAAAEFLTTEAYWARWRDGEVIRRQIREAWRVAGAYDRSGAMVGFARAFGDGGSGVSGGSAYLADVYVLAAHRGAGLGQALVRMMVDEGPGTGKRWMLHTSDAHGLYRMFGFARPSRRYLEREGPDARRAEEIPTLTGKVVRLEPLHPRHAAAVVAAAADGGELYRWTTVPRDIDQARDYVERALADSDGGTAVPFAVVRNEDDTVIGSTRFWNLDFWPWPDREPKGTPDTCEIGHTWLSSDAVRTAANTEMKRLMLTHAFETWQVQSVCLHTDSRNQRSRAAMERLGARFEGVLRAHRLGADGNPRDSARFSITAAEWPQVRQHLAELTTRYA